MPLSEAHKLAQRHYSSQLFELVSQPLWLKIEPRKMSRWERVVSRFADLRDRCRDAWLVLKGDAHIGGDW